MDTCKNKFENLIIQCEHETSEYVDIYIDGGKCETKQENSILIVSISVGTGIHHITLIQRSIFERKIWWIVLIPIFWLVYGGQLFNYYLGYDGKHAQLKFDVDVKSEQIENIAVILRRHVFISKTRFERIYYDFFLKEGRIKNVSQPPSSRKYIIKWRCAQLILPVLCLIIILYGSFHLHPEDMIKGVLLIIFGSVILIYRIFCIFTTKSATEILKNN